MSQSSPTKPGSAVSVNALGSEGLRGSAGRTEMYLYSFLEFLSFCNH